jgi:hypothetical protein
VSRTGRRSGAVRRFAVASVNSTSWKCSTRERDALLRKN